MVYKSNIFFQLFDFFSSKARVTLVRQIPDTQPSAMLLRPTAMPPKEIIKSDKM